MKIAAFLAFVAAASARPASHEVDPEYMGPNGDILLSPGEKLGEMNPLNAMTNPNRCWPGGVLHYQLSTAYTAEEVALIEDGIDDLVTSTMVDGVPCVRIEPRTNQNAYVNVGKNSGCSSYIGRTGSAQAMSLVDSCVRRHGTIMHEFLHAFGYYHEQSRNDRDDYVIVHYDNIQPGRENNFIKYPESSVQLLGTLYDYGSVMHYGPYGFAIDPSKPTIEPLDPNAEIGQRTHMSELDVERVQIFYRCLAPENSKHFKDAKDIILCNLG